MIASSIERKRSASLSISCRCCLAARRRCSITMAHQRRRGTRNRTQKATVIYCMASRLGFGASDGQAALKLSVAPIVPFVRLVSHKVTVAVLVVSDIVIDIVMVAATTAAPRAYLYGLVPTAARFLAGEGGPLWPCAVALDGFSEAGVLPDTNPGDPEKGERSSLFRVLARTPFNSCSVLRPTFFS